MKEALLPGLAGLALFLPGERGEWGNDRANNQVVVSGGSCTHHPALACLLFRATYILGLLNMRIRNSWGNLGLIISKLFYVRIFEYLSKVDKPSSSVNQVVANRRLWFGGSAARSSDRVSSRIRVLFLKVSSVRTVRNRRSPVSANILLDHGPCRLRLARRRLQAIDPHYFSKILAPSSF